MSAIHVTKNAWSKMSRIIQSTKNKYGFIYSASSGGCNGFNFELGLLDTRTYQTLILEKYITVLKEEDTELYVDPKFIQEIEREWRKLGPQKKDSFPKDAKKWYEKYHLCREPPSFYDGMT